MVKNKRKTRVVTVVRTAKKKKTRTGQVGLRSRLLNDPASHYAAAIMNPFHERAYGARVPDLFSAHTQTFDFHATHTIKVDANGSASVFVLPNLTLSCFVPEGTTSAPSYFSAITWGDNTSSGAGWGHSMPGSMQAYRIVGMGARVVSMSSMTNAQGKLLMGSYPIDSFAAVKSSAIGAGGATAFAVSGLTPATNSQKTAANTAAAWGIPLSGGLPVYGNLVQFPGTKVVSVLESDEHPFEIRSRPVDPRAFQFRNTDNLIGYDGVDQTATGFTGRADLFQLAGHEALFVALTGGVASTTTFEVEVIYHVEASIKVDTGTIPNARSYPSTASPVDVNGFQQVIQEVATMPSVRAIIAEGASMVHPLLGKFARMVLQ